MDKKQELKNDIASLKAALKANPPKEAKIRMEATLKQVQAKLDALEKKSRKDTDTKKKIAAAKFKKGQKVSWTKGQAKYYIIGVISYDKGLLYQLLDTNNKIVGEARQSYLKEYKEEKPAPSKPKARRKMEETDIENCENSLKEIREVLDNYSAKTTKKNTQKTTQKTKTKSAPRKKHRFGTRLKVGITEDVGRALRHRVQIAGSVEKLDRKSLASQLQDVEQKAAAFIEALQLLSGNVATKREAQSLVDSLKKELLEKKDTILGKIESKAA